MSILDSCSHGPYRVEIRCPVRFLGPVHVGTGERLSMLTDAPVLRDADGRPMLSGSGIRGVLRDWCEREAPLLGIGEEYIQRLFGATPQGQRHGQADRQGRLRVFDVGLSDETEVRDHVRIERAWGAAARGAKFDQEIVHCKGTEFTLVYEGDGPDDPDLVLLSSGLQALHQGLLAFGGKTAWGLGWAEGQPNRSFKKRCVDRSNAEELSRYLLQRLQPKNAQHDWQDWQVPKASGSCSQQQAPDGNEVTAAASRTRLSAWSWLRLDLELAFDGPMLTAGSDRDAPGANERAPDAAPLRDLSGIPVLAGSSLRGAILNRADYIASTLGCTDVATRLDGSAKDNDGRRSLVRIGEGKLVDAQGSPITNPEEVETIWLDHVAIDRVTSFAADGKLFNCRALASPRFRMPILARWAAEDPLDKAAVALFLLALRDAQAGPLVWVGSRTTRGYGRLAKITVLGGTLSVVDSRARNAPFDVPAGTSLETLGDTSHIKGILTTWSEKVQRCKGATR